MDSIKSKYNNRLINLKNKLEILNNKEESVTGEINKHKQLEKSIDELLKEEIEYSKISEDSLINNI